MQNILNDAGCTLRATADLLAQQAAELAAVGVATRLSAQNADTNADDIAQSLHADLPALAGVPELALAADAQRACVAALRDYATCLNNLSAVLMNSAIRLDGARYAIVGSAERTPPAPAQEPAPLPTYEEIQAEGNGWQEAPPLDESVGKIIDDTAMIADIAAEGGLSTSADPDPWLAEDLAAENDACVEDEYPAAGELLVGGELCLGCGRPCPADRGEYRRCPDCLENDARNQTSPIPEPADEMTEPITETDQRCPGCGELLAYPGELEAGQCRDCQEDVAAGRVAGSWHPNHNAPGTLVTADPDEDDPEVAREDKPRGKAKGGPKKAKPGSPRGKRRRD